MPCDHRLSLQALSNVVVDVSGALHQGLQPNPASPPATLSVMSLRTASISWVAVSIRALLTSSFAPPLCLRILAKALRCSLHRFLDGPQQPFQGLPARHNAAAVIFLRLQGSLRKLRSGSTVAAELPGPGHMNTGSEPRRISDRSALGLLWRELCEGSINLQESIQCSTSLV